MADTPKAFDVIVMPNLYGDVLSDVAAQNLRLGRFGRFGKYWEECAMFKPYMVQPRAGQGKMHNPSGFCKVL